MTFTIVVSRKVYLAALILITLLALFVAGSRWVRAQSLCEYTYFTTVCIKGDGSMRVVGDPADCKAKEEPAFLVNAQKLQCILGPMDNGFQEALGDETAARMAADDELWEAIEALQAPAP